MKTAFIITAILVFVYTAYRTYRIANLDKGLEKLLRNGAVILDVRTPSEFSSGHIPGAINIVLSKLRAPQLPLDTSKIYITYCSHGLRSVKAVDVLKSRGFKHVYNGGAMADLEKVINKK